MALSYQRYDRLEPLVPAAGAVSLERVRGAERTGVAEELQPSLAGVVAVVGCDGTGKTRLAADLVASLRGYGPAERRYMGLVSGEFGDKIKQLPVIGTRLEKYLAARVRRAQDMDKKLPGLFAAIVMYLFSAWRVAKVRQMMRLARNGTLVIAERYPQAEVGGFHYDGPGLTVGRTTNWLVRKLAMREQKLYDWMARQRPGLIIRLTIDAETAFARKSDHPLSELRDKIEIMPRIRYNGAEVREIDSRMPYPQVLDAALRAIGMATAASR
jgi:thymidylate kinase